MSAIKTFLLLLALLCVFHPSLLCEAAVCYVKPTEPHNATCPSEPCHTLDKYVSNSTKYFISNTVFMFLTGYHKLSYNLTVFDVHNITLRPYIEKTSVIIDSEHMLLFELSSDIVIRDMTFQTLGTMFDNSTNVTLTGLRVENASIVLNNVFGEVNISHLKSNFHGNVQAALVMMWTATQPQYVPNTVVLLHKLDLRQIADGIGVIIGGCIPGKVVLMNSTVNAFIGIYMELGPSCNEMLFICENTYFYNYNDLAGLYVETSLHHEHIMAIVLHNVSFIGYYYAVILANAYVQNVTISNSYFGSSSGGTITASNSVLTLKGNVTFRDNYSDSNGGGGAISLDGNSQILIPEPPNTYILFENNTSVDTGGAIYFTGSSTTGYCKIFVEQYSSKIVFNFSRNTAVNGGNAIYGAYLSKPCYSPNETMIKNISQLILNVSYFTPSFSDDLSVISSDAQTLCFCDEDEKLRNCSGPSYPNYHSVYPGQVFRLLVAACGDMNGLVRWPVYARVDQGKFGNKIQHSQSTNAERCAYFKYSVVSTENSATLEFSLRSSSSSSTINSYTVNLLDCPLGFSLSNNSGCKCQEYLFQNVENLACNITEQSIRRQGTTWIGVVENSTGSITLENTTALAFSNVCPFHYCSISKVKIFVNQTSFFNEDIQCTDDRSGVLCGGCRNNFSLALGSNRCLHGCSNNSLSLLIAFAAAGIALVFFIKILNLTVSQGTINGLIFYANIIGAEQTVLFSSRAYEGFLSVFIAWVNLDLGFETCFFDGMDAYAKAWLQFVFPVYVWVIALFIIILSHYSIRASKLFGNNSVPVLATLILLSYSKLLRAVISALSITHIQFLNGSTMSVWEKDGNIQYLTGKHIPLFVFAVAVLILLWFPFTLVLVSIQWLQRGTHYRVLCWVTRLRPFFEAFTGPLKDKHRYWVGALLLARCSLLFVFYLYTANGDGIAFVSITFAVLIILVFLAATGFVYRNYFLIVLELSYILNLGILATGTLYVQYINDSGNQEALVMTCVGIAFLQFIATVIYHAYVQLREPLTKLKTKIVGIGSQEDADIITDYGSLNVAPHVEQPIQRPSYQEMSNYREPLLAYLSD